MRHLVFRRTFHDRKRPNHHTRTPQALGARPVDAADVRRLSTGGVDIGLHRAGAAGVCHLQRQAQQAAEAFRQQCRPLPDADRVVRDVCY